MILKQLREKKRLTQENVAAKMRCGVSTVQGWERDERIPKEQLHKLLDIYEVSQEQRVKAVLEIFGEKRDNATEDASVDNFPYFLFDDEDKIRKRVQGLSLTAEEMEIFGYCHYLDGKEYHSDYSDVTFPQAMDYRFIQDHGGIFATLHKISDIKARVWPDEIADTIFNFGMRHPGLGFSLAGLSNASLTCFAEQFGSFDSKKLYDICSLCIRPQEIEKYSYNRSDAINNILDDYSYSSYNYKESPKLKGSLPEVFKKCVEIIRKENGSPGYLEEKKQYETDVKAYNEHPALYDREPEFKPDYRYYIQLTETGKEYLKWYKE